MYPLQHSHLRKSGPPRIVSTGTRHIATPRRDARLWAAAVFIFAIEALLCSPSLVGFPGPARFDAKQWTLAYQHAIVRRGLLGTMLRCLHLDNGNYLLISILGWIVGLALFLVIARSVYRLLAQGDTIPGVLLTLAILFSPLTSGGLIHAIADPLQVSLLLFFGSVLLLNRYARSWLAPFLCFGALGVVTVLIHEASVFFVVPFLVLQTFLLRRSRSDRAALLGYLAGAVPILLIVVRATQHNLVGAAAPLHYFGKSLDSADVWDVTANFSTLLHHEDSARFARGLHGYVLLVRNIVGGLWLPGLFTIVLGYVYRTISRTSFKRWVRAALLLLALNAPLWVIAHDYGRFSSYLFFGLLIMVESSGVHELRPGDNISVPLPVLGLLLLIAGISDQRILGYYVNKGLGGDNYTFLSVIALSIVAIWQLFRRSEANQAVEEPEAGTAQSRRYQIVAGGRQ